MEFFKNLFGKKEGLLYFEAHRSPLFDSVCSDPECPCQETEINNGSGYLYISKEVVDFRRNTLTVKELERKLESMAQSGGFLVAAAPTLAFPSLICEKSAKRKKLDLKIATADAKYWWEKELVPLRETPLAGSKKAMQERERLGIKKWLNNN